MHGSGRQNSRPGSDYQKPSKCAERITTKVDKSMRKKPIRCANCHKWVLSHKYYIYKRFVCYDCPICGARIMVAKL